MRIYLDEKKYKETKFLVCMVKVKLSQRFLAFVLSKSEKVEDEIYGEIKRDLLSKLNGPILEIGAGTGTNLRYYPKNTKLIFLEPNPIMRKHIERKTLHSGIKIIVLKNNAEKIPLKDESVDFVVSTLVLCSVENVDKVLKEIYRVLKKGGKFIFIEHVADVKGSLRRKLQDFSIHTPWKFFSDGCHPNRETWNNIKKSQFKNVKIKKFMIKGNTLSYLVKPHIYGMCIK